MLMEVVSFIPSKISVVAEDRDLQEITKAIPDGDSKQNDLQEQRLHL